MRQSGLNHTTHVMTQSRKLADNALAAIEEILKRDGDILSAIFASRKRIEGWLQLEIYKILRRRYESTAIFLEYTYPDSTKRCDFWAKEADGSESWLELKCCVTNYVQKYGSASARPITNQISEVTLDIDKLQLLPTQSTRSLILLAYPLPLNHTMHTQWQSHLLQLTKRSCVLTATNEIISAYNQHGCRVVFYQFSLPN